MVSESLLLIIINIMAILQKHVKLCILYYPRKCVFVATAVFLSSNAKESSTIIQSSAKHTICNIFYA